MKIRTALSIALASLPLAANEVRLRIVDENATPLEGVKTLIAFTTPVFGGAVRREGLTDRNGGFAGSGQAVGSVLVRASKAGHYSAFFDRLSRDVDLDLTVVLPRVINPIPLFALSRIGDGGGVSLRFPRQNEWLGYDFAAGDWTQPFGKGASTDIRFRFRNEFKGWKRSDSEIARAREHPTARDLSEEEFKHLNGKFDGELEISFLNPQEGLHEVTDRFLPYSVLKMPHRAPDDGYVPTWRYTATTYQQSSVRLNVGFFIRTRVKVDKYGKFISANYAKVHGDFHLDPRGSLMFCHYFNPTPNDRNLEFDPRKNLFPADTRGANVFDP